MCTILVCSLILLSLVPGEALPVVTPLLAIVAIAAGAITHLYYRDEQLPVLDVGALTILTTAIYSAVPLLGFWLAGLRWTPYSYLPLFLHNPGPGEVGAFAWRHVLYLGSFTAGYLLYRGRVRIGDGRLRELRPSAVAAVFMLAAGLIGYFEWLRVQFGVSYDPSYSDLTANVASVDALPHVVRQLSHNFFAILFLLKLGLVLWLMTHWDQWRWRSALILWLVMEGVATIMRMGGRTWFVMLLMATGLLYHRLVKPLTPLKATAVVVLLLGGALTYGVARDVGGGIGAVAGSDVSPWATMNEFQAFYGMAYDLHVRKAAGTLGPIPWQIYANDFVMLVPSQLLPFTKSDPCMGYPKIDGVGLGCVMGVISNAVIGLDWLELLLRGLGLGVLFAVVHRWYSRHQSSYWATLFYLCLCLWSYYTFRSSSLHFAYYVVYRFIPMLIAVRLVQAAVRQIRRGFAPAVA